MILGFRERQGIFWPDPRVFLDIRFRESWRGPAANLLTCTEAVQVTNTDDRPDLSSEGAPDIDKTVNVKQSLTSGHETQRGLDTKTD
jgi:hypothetical protein